MFNTEEMMWKCIGDERLMKDLDDNVSFAEKNINEIGKRLEIPFRPDRRTAHIEPFGLFYHRGSPFLCAGYLGYPDIPDISDIPAVLYIISQKIHFVIRFFAFHSKYRKKYPAAKRLI